MKETGVMKQKTSRADKAALMILGMVDAQAMFIGNAYRDQEKNKTIMDLVARVTEAVESARKSWPGSLPQKDVNVMKSTLRRYLEEHLPTGTRLEAAVITSLSLDLLDRLYGHVRGNTRKAGPLRACLSRAKRLHWYFDRWLNKFKCYDVAKMKAEAFYREAENL
jgi:hypothetical protein